jgi:guanosine-3',5'-bis(diphosphate) 3'-pyrophosphohydrolase
MTIQSLYQNALQFATQKHSAINQVVLGTNLPHVVHISNVAMEILIASKHTEGSNAYVAVQVALLHDTIEDTQTTLEEINANFGEAVA